jgi:hypothetical protein
VRTRLARVRRLATATRTRSPSADLGAREQRHVGEAGLVDGQEGQGLLLDAGYRAAGQHRSDMLGHRLVIHPPTVVRGRTA